MSAFGQTSVPKIISTTEVAQMDELLNLTFETAAKGFLRPENAIVIALAGIVTGFGFGNWVSCVTYYLLFFWRQQRYPYMKIHDQSWIFRAVVIEFVRVTGSRNGGELGWCSVLWSTNHASSWSFMNCSVVHELRKFLVIRELSSSVKKVENTKHKDTREEVGSLVIV